jgi:hypothetical protein
MKKLFAALFAVAVTAAPAMAQDYKPVDVNVGFGWIFPVGNIADEFDAGWNGSFGVTFNFNEHLGVQAEYIYGHMNGPDRNISISDSPVGAAITNGLIESNHQMHIGSFNLIYKAQGQDRPIGGYVLGGAGIYHRKVQLTSPQTGYTTICDPYWYVCYPTLVPIDLILGERSSNDFGIDFGGGITFGHGAKFYIETRYHYVFGKDVTPPAGSSVTCPNNCSTSASYWPLTFGVRW